MGQIKLNIIRRPALLLLCLLLLGGVLASARASPNFDEQIGVTFTTVSTQTMAYNVTAIAQNTSEGFGPVYLLQGVSPQNYWYQIGLAYDWPANTSTGTNPGFFAMFSVWNPNRTTIYPSSPGSAILNLSGPIYNGDKVLLEMSFKNGKIYFYVRDWNTNATATVALDSLGQTSFSSTLYSNNYAGTFTGLMTEWYHVNPNYKQEGNVTYSPVLPMGRRILRERLRLHL
jgi:hypothetical protein